MTALLHPTASVLDIAEKLEAAGFEAWCVGGAIRDALLGHPHLDIAERGHRPAATMPVTCNCTAALGWAVTVSALRTA